MKVRSKEEKKREEYETILVFQLPILFAMHGYADVVVFKCEVLFRLVNYCTAAICRTGQPYLFTVFSLCLLASGY